MVTNTWARIENATVAEITTIDPKDRFHPALIWVICPRNTQPGMQWIDGVFSPATAPTIDHSRTIAAARYQHETAGLTLDRISIETSRESQALITAAAVSALIDPNYTCTWKTLNGPVELTATQLIGLATAVRSHIQGCFNREFELLDALNKGTYTPDMLDHGWPTAPGT